MLGADARLMVIEMTVVRPPCVIDFGNSRLDVKPDYTQEQWDYWFEKLADDFGEVNWPEAEAVYYELKNKWGIYHLDLSTNNVRFPADSTGAA